MNLTLTVVIAGLLVTLAACAADAPDPRDTPFEETPADVPVEDLEDDLSELGIGLEDLDMIDEDLEYSDAELE